MTSDSKGWTHGKEKGTHNYIENISSKKNGCFIAAWESEILRKIFTNVRNLAAHGAGAEKMVELNRQQTNWVIETCMSWIKSLIKRM